MNITTQLENSNVQTVMEGTQRVESKQAPLKFSWLEIPPDGSEKNVELFLLRLEKFLGAKAFLAVGSSLDRLLIISTDGHEYGENLQRQEVIRNSLREACSPEENCRFALSNGHTSLLLKKVLEDQGCYLVVSFRLSSIAGESRGPQCASLILAIDPNTEMRSATDCAQLVESLRKLMVPWLEIWWLSHCGLHWEKTFGNMGRLLLNRKKRFVIAVAVFFATLWLPVPYWPSRDCVLEPAKKSFIASPIDGVLKDIVVRPGDEVAAGSLLARLDDEALRWELSTVQADMESAGKRRDAALTTRNAGELRLAQLEQERYRVAIESLEKQLNDLELCSPVEGIIVQGNIDEHNGMPVTRGDTLFEIAPLDRMRMDIHLSSADLANVKVGQVITLRVDADRWSQWSATITRIAPRGIVIDSKVVFIATAEIDNTKKILRPGMNGKARISAGMKSIGWLVFSKPYEWLISKFYW